MTRLYAFYNWSVGRQGEPFRLCDECIKKQPIPPNCYLNKPANDAVGYCQADWHEAAAQKENGNG